MMLKGENLNQIKAFPFYIATNKIYFASLRCYNQTFSRLRVALNIISENQYAQYGRLVQVSEKFQGAVTCSSSNARGNAGLHVVPSGLSIKAIPTAAKSFRIKSDLSYSLFFLAASLSAIFW